MLASRVSAATKLTENELEHYKLKDAENAKRTAPESQDVPASPRSRRSSRATDNSAIHRTPQQRFRVYDVLRVPPPRDDGLPIIWEYDPEILAILERRICSLSRTQLVAGKKLCAYINWNQVSTDNLLQCPLCNFSMEALQIVSRQQHMVYCAKCHQEVFGHPSHCPLLLPLVQAFWSPGNKRPKNPPAFLETATLDRSQPEGLEFVLRNRGKNLEKRVAEAEHKADTLSVQITNQRKRKRRPQHHPSSSSSSENEEESTEYKSVSENESSFNNDCKVIPPPVAISRSRLKATLETRFLALQAQVNNLSSRRSKPSGSDSARAEFRDCKKALSDTLS